MENLSGKPIPVPDAKASSSEAEGETDTDIFGFGLSILSGIKVKKPSKPKPTKAFELPKPKPKPTGPRINRELKSILTETQIMDLVMEQQATSSYKPKLSELREKNKPVTKWKWVPFTNPARKHDPGFQLHRWEPETGPTNDSNYDYGALQNVEEHVPVPKYTDDQYREWLQRDDWTKEETDHLFKLCQRFDLRFMTIEDRWDRERFGERTVEDLKERYYSVCAILSKHGIGDPAAQSFVFDADYERKRKQALKEFYSISAEEAKAIKKEKKKQTKRKTKVATVDKKDPNKKAVKKPQSSPSSAPILEQEPSPIQKLEPSPTSPT